MKKFALIITAFIISLLCTLNVCAATYGEFSVDTLDLTVKYENKGTKAVADILKIDVKDLEDQLGKENVLFAVNKDLTFVFSLSVFKDDFSALTGDLSGVDGNALEEIEEQLSPGEDFNSTTEEINDRTYLVFSSVQSDSNGAYTTKQYVTVANGKAYQLVFNNAGEKADEKVLDIMSTFKINKAKTASVPLWETLLIAAGVALFVTIAVICVIGLFKKEKES